MFVDPLAEITMQPYSAFNNNPIYFIDPTGMISNDWKKDKSGNYVYDSNLTELNASTQLGENETYLGETYSFDVTNNEGSKIGSVNLNSDGTASYTENGQTVEFDNTTVDLGFDSGHTIKTGSWETGDTFSKGIWTVGTAASVLDYTPGSFRLTNGAYNGNAWSPKYYPSGWKGGSVARISTYNIGNVAKSLGMLAFTVSTLNDAYGVTQYYNNSNSSSSVHPGKAAFNLGMNIYGMYYNPIAAGLYGALEAFYPGKTMGAIRDFSKFQSEYREHNNGAVLKPTF